MAVKKRVQEDAVETATPVTAVVSEIVSVSQRPRIRRTSTRVPVWTPFNDALSHSMGELQGNGNNGDGAGVWFATTVANEEVSKVRNQLNNAARQLGCKYQSVLEPAGEGQTTVNFAAKLLAEDPEAV